MAADVYAGKPPSVTARLLGLIVPAPCLGCGTPLAGRSAPFGLCAGCRGRLIPWHRATSCAACGRPLVGVLPRGFRCRPCRDRPPAYDRLSALWHYQPPLDAVIAGLKFRRLDYLGRHLGEALADAFAADLAGHAEPAEQAEAGGVDLVVPVPLHWTRRLARGYNQAERIARPLADRLGLPVTRLLRRPRATAPQSTLGRDQRLANLHSGVLRLRSGAPLAGRRVLLVDDVATTGATLEAAARVLKQGGAATVLALVVGRTPGV
ncbi:MAG TPA: ComF family protein [Thermoanaerobaculia bacterium]|nr:ComF family protein [Thermoanaerobaculia bacterium]